MILASHIFPAEWTPIVLVFLSPFDKAFNMKVVVAAQLQKCHLVGTDTAGLSDYDLFIPLLPNFQLFFRSAFRFYQLLRRLERLQL